MPFQSVRFFHHSHLLTTLLSLLTNRVFWAVISFFTNLAGFILICSSAFLVDQFGKELKWSVLTVFLVGIYIVPTLLFCTLLWGPQIKNKLQNNLLLRVVLIYFCFIVICVASHLDKNPRFHIKMEDQDSSNSRKVYNILSSGAFALTALGLSRAIDLQFEIGFFFYFLGDAMVVSLGIVGKDGHKNWSCILATGIFCFLLIFLGCYLDILTHKRHTSNIPTGQRRTQPPDSSTDTTIESMANVDIEAIQIRTTQAKPNINGSPTEASQSRNIQIYSRASMVNEGSGQIETRIMQESWLVDDDQWEIISPSVDMDTSISSEEFEVDEDVPSPSSPRRTRVVKEKQEDMETSVGSGEFEDEDVPPPHSRRSRAVKEEDENMETSKRLGEFEDDENEDVPSPRSPRSRTQKEEEDSLGVYMEKTISYDSGGYEEDDVSLSVSKIEGSVDQGQASVSQDSEKDADTHLATSGRHDHRSDCEELRDDIVDIAVGSVDSEKVDDVPLLPKIDRIGGESRVMNTEFGDRDTKSRSRSPIITRNLHVDDLYLGTCGHCKCSLAPHHHTYMYRGNMAFCSLRCRLQQSKQDERKEETNQQREHGKRKEGHCGLSPTSNEDAVHIFFICNLC